jgi:hypothetical protein
MLSVPFGKIVLSVNLFFSFPAAACGENQGTRQYRQ